MKTNHYLHSFLFILGLATLSVSTAHAQFADDALRFSSTGFGVGSRAQSMGGAYIGVADDYSASFWNPAGLAQMRRLEFTGGIINTNYSNNATFFGNLSTATNSSTALDNLGFVFPVPTSRGSLVFSAGYNRVNNFTTALSFNGFNPKSSIISSLYDPDGDFDIPFQTYLENKNGYTPIQKNVQQQGNVRESGNIGTWAFSGAIDIEKDFSFGLTINLINGTYKYVRNYTERDVNNVYNDPTRFYDPTTGNVLPDSLYREFNAFYYDNALTSELSGANVMFGFMYRYEDVARFGLTIKTPTSITVHEKYSNAGQSAFDDTTGYYYAYDANNDYGITTPWVFGAGASFTPFEGLLLSGQIEYTDWTQIQWTDNSDLENENNLLKQEFRSTLNYAVGGEFEIPKTELRVRAGYSFKPSAYVGDPSSFGQTTITAGAGVLLQDNVMVDVAAMFGSFKTYHNNYGDAALNLSRTDESISTTNIDLTISYRF